MGSKTIGFENSLLLHIFQNADIANIGDAGGLQNSLTAGNLYVALCTTATTSNDDTAGTECAYGSYARQAVPRNSGGWTVAGSVASNAAAITFPTASSGSETVRYFEIWTALASGTRLFWGQLDADRSITTGDAPTFAIGALTITED
jgi:hypothetical protein